jgi:hypothetical protein
MAQFRGAYAQSPGMQGAMERKGRTRVGAEVAPRARLRAT